MHTLTRFLTAGLVLAALHGCASDDVGDAPMGEPIEGGDDVTLIRDDGAIGSGLAVFVSEPDGSTTTALWLGPRRLLDFYADEASGGTYIFPSETARQLPRIRVPGEGERVVRSDAPEAQVEAPARPVEATSLLGEPLLRPEITDETLAAFEANLDDALADRSANPEDPDSWIWVGRRQAYLGRYGDAIATFAEGSERWGEDPRFLRHRGHRYITIRELEAAEADLDAARELIDVSGLPDQVEPDGLPNARGIPVSTLHSNVRYHLALARYLMGDFEGAEVQWARDVDAAVNPDMVVASSYWLWLTRMRLDRPEQAQQVLEGVTDDMDIIENTAYHRLLLLFRGDLTEEELLGTGADALQNTTTAYGVGAWHLVNGRADRAREIFSAIVAGDGPWGAFGYIAAEAELAR